MIRLTCLALLFASFLSACGGTSGADGSSGAQVPDADDPAVLARVDVRDTGQVFPYRPDSPYAPVLKSCALIASRADACPLGTLPFIAQASDGFSRADIMDRLLVTHDWMGARFEALLDEAPESMISLFGSVTLITIGSKVRPSNYWTGTGGIQLDPAYLWLTVAEKANISIEDDYRSDFGADLQFWSFGALRAGDFPAEIYFNLTDLRERSFEQIKMPLYRLLYHELAHAVDFLPAASIPLLDNSLQPLDALSALSDFFLSPQLYDYWPLQSEVLLDLARVSFWGENATRMQKTFTPGDVGAQMAGDGAVRYYAYSTLREDFATLFAMSMMKMHFGLDYHLAYVQKPTDINNYGCDELIVGWGQRNRLADPLVRERARWVVEQIQGYRMDIDNFFNDLVGQVDDMTPGVDWCTNRDKPAQADSGDSFRSRAAGQGVVHNRSREQLLGERELDLHAH